MQARVMLAAILLSLRIGVCAAARAQAPPSFDARRLPFTTDSFAAYLIHRADTTLNGFVVSTLRSDGTRLTRVWSNSSQTLSSIDTLVDRLPDLRPLAQWTHSSAHTARLAFDSARVSGWLRLPNGDSSAVDATFPAGAYNGSDFDLLVQASELREGLELDVPGFQMVPSVIARMKGRVTGSESVSGRPCWVFKGDNAGVPVEFWIDKSTRALRQLLIQFQVDQSYLLTALPPTMVGITDGEKARLIVGPASVRHPDLGFVVPLPGAGFTIDTALQRQVNQPMAGHLDLFGWVLRDSTRSIVVILEIYKGFARTRPALQRFAAEIHNSFTPDLGWESLEDSVYWEPDREEARFWVHGRNGSYIKSRCIPTPPGRTPAVLVCAQTISVSKDRFDSVTEGLTVGASAP
jgi:hypothetical protein